MNRAGPGAASPSPAPSRPVAPETSGLLVVDKPAGPTSHDVVAKVRRALGAPGAGHLGTLDPPATGLLLVALGAATRCIPEWQGGEKTYEVTIRFGVETSTEDLTGEVIARHQVNAGEPEIRQAALAWVGETLQVPPMVSARKVQGRRLHALARQGITVEREARSIRVAEWTWLDFALPEARARIRCSGGTYVRSLARDLGRALGCGAAVAQLRRLRSEPFGLERAVTFRELDECPRDDLWRRGGIPLGEALGAHPRMTLTGAESAAVGRGNAFRRPAAIPAAIASGGLPARPMALVLEDEAGVPLALAERRSDPGDSAIEWIQPRAVFPWAVAEGPR